MRFLVFMVVGLVASGVAGAAVAWDDGGSYCREYTREVWIGGELRRVHGTACGEPGGFWSTHPGYEPSSAWWDRKQQHSSSGRWRGPDAGYDGPYIMRREYVQEPYKTYPHTDRDGPGHRYYYSDEDWERDQRRWDRTPGSRWEHRWENRWERREWWHE